MKRFNILTKKTASLLIAGIISTGCVYSNINDMAIAEAASYSEDIDGQITDLEKNLEILNKKKMKQEADLNKEKINSLEKSIENINKNPWLDSSMRLRNSLLSSRILIRVSLMR